MPIPFKISAKLLIKYTKVSSYHENNWRICEINVYKKSVQFLTNIDLKISEKYRILQKFVKNLQKYSNLQYRNIHISLILYYYSSVASTSRALVCSLESVAKSKNSNRYSETLCALVLLSQWLTAVQYFQMNNLLLNLFIWFANKLTPLYTKCTVAFAP